MAFIFDKLCSDTEITKLINIKRTFKETDDPNALGGLKVGEKPYKLPGDKRKEMKEKIAVLQEKFGVKKALPKKWPKLEGAHQRLYDDAGYKEERRAMLKEKVDAMIEEQLLKSLQLKNNDMQVFKNQIIMNGFLE